MKPAPAKNTGNTARKKPTGSPAAKKAELKFDLPGVKKWLIIAGLAIFTFVLYGNTIMHDYALDDDIITRQNQFVQEGVHGIGHIFSKGFLYGFNRMNDQSYRPVTLTSVAIEKQIWGNNPHVHHFFNILWYAITAIFLFLTLTKIFRKYNYVVPLFITLLFIAHPVHTEVVANIKSRDEILSFLFCIIAIYFSIQYYCYPDKPAYYEWLSWVFFSLAVLSKETVLTYAVIIPMMYYFFTDFSFKKLIRIAIPFFVLVGVYMYARSRILDSITFNEQLDVINNSLMAAKSSSDRLATAILTMGKYIWLLFLPLSLTFDYSYRQIPVVSFSNPEALLSVAVYAGLIIYALFRMKKKDPVAFGILYYMITMTLVSNIFVKIGSSMGERFLYTSSLGFCIVVGILIMRLLKIKMDAPRPKLSTLYSVAGIILFLYSVKTIARNADWKNNFTLFEADVNTSPNSARAHQSLAIIYTDTAIHSTDPAAKSNFFNKAIIQYNEALKILPTYSEALYNKGWNYYSMGNYDSAAAAFAKCIEYSPKYISAYQDLGVIYFNRKDYVKAISIFKDGLKVNQNDAAILENLAGAYYNSNQYDSAIVYLQRTLKINPNIQSAQQTLVKAENALRASRR